MLNRSTVPTRFTGHLELAALESLPCGCVAAAYKAVPWAIELIRVEAKGPHCVHTDHAAGRLLDVGADAPDGEEEDAAIEESD